MTATKRRAFQTALSAGVLLGLLFGIGWRLAERPPAPSSAEPVEAAPRPTQGAAVEAPGDPKPVEPPRRYADAPPPLDPPLRPAEGSVGIDDETSEIWRERLARQRAAQERFERGLEESQVRARDIDARVREALQRTVLEPELLDGGQMTGLRIRSIEGGSPLAEAGFREGDLIVRLDGEPLDDPYELPRLLSRAGPQLSLCVVDGSGELCRDLVLR